MSKSILTLLAATAGVLALSGIARAEDAPASPFTANIGAVTDYRYRGISQSRLKPALQGGMDYAHPSGFYVGTWASTIKWVTDSYGDAQIEWDIYGGYKGDIVKDSLSYDVGLLQYVYPGASTTKWDAAYKNPNTTEIYGALTFGPVTTKLSYALTNLFGNYDFAANNSSKGSLYLDLSASFEVGGVTLVPHVGYQKVKDITNASYTDYSFTISKDFNGLVPSLALVGTNANESFYVPGGAANSTQFLGKTALVLGIKYTF
jgi:uncharacterized protein (TIGR02001 family)